MPFGFIQHPEDDFLRGRTLNDHGVLYLCVASYNIGCSNQTDNITVCANFHLQTCQQNFQPGCPKGCTRTTKDAKADAALRDANRIKPDLTVSPPVKEPS